MRAVSALILASAALLQLFSGFASAATCDDTTYVCQADGYVRDPTRDAIDCIIDATLCSDDDCCIQGQLCADHQCTATGEKVDPAKVADVCPGLTCVDADCCGVAGDACSTYSCQGIGTTMVSGIGATLCTNDCTDDQCCEVTGKCRHYSCVGSNMVSDPAEEDTDCSGSGSAPACDDAHCCMVTCASDNYACSTGTRNDDATCTGGTCRDGECCTATVSCNAEAYECPTMYHRIGANMCLGTGLCTNADCCAADVVPTITEARMMKTPPSRQHLTQYGTN